MRCSDVVHWLDEGMPPAGAGPAAVHAASCPACARAVGAAASVERALAVPPPVPPGGADRFVASVLEAIRTEQVTTHAPEPAPARASHRSAPRPTVSRVLAGLISEPSFVLGAVALLTIALFPALSRGVAGQSLASAAAAVTQDLGGAKETIVQTVLVYPAAVATLDPYARATLITCFLALLVWGGFWIAGALDRSPPRGAGRRA